MKNLLLIGILTFFSILLVGCSQQQEIIEEENFVDDKFPILEGQEFPPATNYFVCESEETDESIYKSTRCGRDTCWSKFYDKNGELVEETGESGPGTPTPYETRTQVRNCERTTEDYFKSKVIIK